MSFKQHLCAPILLTLALLAASFGGVAPAAAQSARAYLDHTVQLDDREKLLFVYSPSMDKVIPLRVITPARPNVPRPTFYLLNGAGGGEDGANWFAQTDIADFFADKNVNVVLPIGGAYSYYTDWKRDDPKLGRNKWTTFLTRELPPVVDAALHTSHQNAIAGLSMSASSVLNLAIAAPGLYRAVGSYSGCSSTTDNLSQTYIKLVLDRGDAKAENMWGPPGDPLWRANDAVLNAEGLRGTALYISNSSGLPGSADTLTAKRIGGQVFTLANQIILGGVIEAATRDCTNRLLVRLSQLGIPAQVELRSAGTHSWAYWQDDLHKSWPMIAANLGI